EAAEALSREREKSCALTQLQDGLIRKAERILESETDTDIRRSAECYLDFSKKAESYLINSYSRLESIISARPGKKVYVLPGNYDMDLQKTALKNRDLHKKSFEIEDIRISGYGSAAVMTPGLPEHLKVHYDEDDLVGFLQ
ncbi:MAG: hypothetical protein COW41_09280, partial [Deltaproteobacteria bacterium CG17_big_fil_post_rev_8_21_14_2_50_51_6]